MADPPADWEYHDNCWCEWCVAERAKQGGSPEAFTNQETGDGD